MSAAEIDGRSAFTESLRRTPVSSMTQRVELFVPDGYGLYERVKQDVDSLEGVLVIFENLAVAWTGGENVWYWINSFHLFVASYRPMKAFFFGSE
jgi:hypothetical protein